MTKPRRPNFAKLFEEMVIKPLLAESKKTGLHPYEVMAGVTPEQKKFRKAMFPCDPKYTKRKRR